VTEFVFSELMMRNLKCDSASDWTERAWKSSNGELASFQSLHVSSQSDRLKNGVNSQNAMTTLRHAISFSPVTIGHPSAKMKR
jgi:hypothetical protein